MGDSELVVVVEGSSGNLVKIEKDMVKEVFGNTLAFNCKLFLDAIQQYHFIDRNLGVRAVKSMKIGYEFRRFGVGNGESTIGKHLNWVIDGAAVVEMQIVNTIKCAFIV